MSIHHSHMQSVTKCRSRSSDFSTHRKASRVDASSSDSMSGSDHDIRIDIMSNSARSKSLYHSKGLVAIS